MDEFEGAIRHSSSEPCALIAEVHSILIYNLRTVPFTRFNALHSLSEMEQELGENDTYMGLPLYKLHESLTDIGNNWERAPLRPHETREGWEESLLGCLKDVSD